MDGNDSTVCNHLLKNEVLPQIVAFRQLLMAFFIDVIPLLLKTNQSQRNILLLCEED